MKKLITVVTPCFNEKNNIELIYKEVKKIFNEFKDIEYRHLFIDNASTDGTRLILKKLAIQDVKVQLILNSRNFGPIKSPYYGLMQAKGDAVILIVADLQDPPILIKDFIKLWSEGYKIVIGVKENTEEKGIMSLARKIYYIIITKISEIKLEKNYTGFGIYDKVIIDELNKIQSPFPYFRGLISEIGFEIKRVKYFQPLRKKGKSKYSFYNLYQVAMLGITSHSFIPLRIATILGFIIGFISLLTSVSYLILKIIYWDKFPLGVASILIAIFFFASVQIFFIGILGEYIGAVLLMVKKGPLVVEEERINL